MKKIYMSQDGKVLKRVTKNSSGEIIIPEGTEVIAKRALANCESVTSVVIPSSVREIGEEAFEFCESLESIVIPEGVEIIPKRAFAKCYFLTSVKLPSTLKEIGKEAFIDTGIERISIPDGIEVIDEFTFSGSWSLESVSLPSSLKEIHKNAFYDSNNLSSIVIPEGVETIADAAFKHCTNLKAAILPSSLTTMGKEAFSQCGLGKIEIPASIETIPDKCFEDCSSLSEVVFHDGLKEIGDEAFSQCCIKYIEICATVETIGEKAFSGNKPLSIHIGTAVRSIGNNAFWVNAPSSIKIDSNNQVYTDADCNVIMEKETGKVIRGTINSKIPDTATKIAFGAFQAIPQTLVIPSSVSEIETAAFANCPDGSYIIFQEGVKTLRWGAFQQMNDKRLSVFIPSSVCLIEGQFSTVEFHLIDGNPHYRYDAEGHNIISKEGVLVWGHLLKGIPMKGVKCVEVINYGKTSFSELTVPDTISSINIDFCRYATGLNKFVFYCDETTLEMPEDWTFNCETRAIIQLKKTESGIIKNIEYIFPKGSSMNEIREIFKKDPLLLYFE